MNMKVLKIISKNWKITDSLYLKCVLYLFKIFGLATPNLQIRSTSSKIPIPLLTRSKVGQTYNLILAIGIGLIYAETIRGAAKFYSKQNISRFNQAIDYAHTSMATITAVFVLLVFCIQQEKYMNVGNRLMHLVELAVDLYEKQRLCTPKTLTKNVKNIYITIGMTWLSIFVTTEIRDDFRIFVYFFFIYLCNQIITSTLLQYSVILRSLQQILRIVNEAFRQFSKEPSQLKMKIQFSKLRELYLSVCEIAESIERLYSKPMLFCIAYIFITLIFFANFITQPMIMKNSTISNFHLCHCSFRILHYVVSLIILVKSVMAAVSESKRTGRIVNKWLSDYDTLQVDPKIYHFSNYLLHHNLHFSVFDLFSLDGSLLMSITASITTYLVIFLQFQE